MERIHETLFILHKCDHYIELVWEAVEAHKQKGPLFARHHFTQNLTHYIILESLSFLEEYRTHFIEREVEEEYRDRVKIVRDVCKPIFRQINKWKGLESFRNNFIAHPWRNSRKLVVPLSNEYEIPRTWIEFQFLKDLVHYMHETIRSEFKKEMDYAIFFSDELSENVTPKYRLEDINNEVIAMNNEVNKLMEVHGKNYNYTVYKYE